MLPDARWVRDAAASRCRLGEADAIAYLEAKKAYDDIVCHYRDTLVRHRRAMLRLNTA
jgi:cobalt-zinc-cadmium efflux system outer membrane protein